MRGRRWNFIDTHLKESIQEFKRRANQEASVHGHYADGLDRIERWINVPSLLLATTLLAAVFLDASRAESLFGIPPNRYAITIAVLSILNFGGVLLLLFFQPKQTADRHRAAVEHYTQMKYAAGDLLKNENGTTQDLHALEARYLNNRALPTIPGWAFNRLKRAHLIKVDVSKELSRNPHRTIREIRKELREKGRP